MARNISKTSSSFIKLDLIIGLDLWALCGFILLDCRDIVDNYMVENN